MILRQIGGTVYNLQNFPDNIISFKLYSNNTQYIKITLSVNTASQYNSITFLVKTSVDSFLALLEDGNISGIMALDWEVSV